MHRSPNRVRIPDGRPVEVKEPSMCKRSYDVEADACRRQAKKFTGRPESQFLLRVARSFEELEREDKRARHAAT